jgi:predicted metal-dependent hydrolase
MPKRYILFYPLIDVKDLNGLHVIDIRKCKFTEIDIMDSPDNVIKLLGNPLFIIDTDNIQGNFKELFYECRFWEAHEVLEREWKKSSGELKKYFQALILICASMIKFLKKQYDVSDKLLQNALSLISELPKDLFPLFYVYL